ncbi:MAG: LuxR family transcriptional regulator [Hydrocarboniphaga sp.]|uniref:helix-turn-helix transcriptional regulator n=1 Tax=Hydrocarboniphaga sp. TaxID=2033016 RepID=UPI0026086D4E|nr:hypothetical protein [Hydrocarboniphaga sp.]MDB5967924.1 LuxR family transcriptional regulator [Hydrocarboniphaga sp.]
MDGSMSSGQGTVRIEPLAASIPGNGLLAALGFTALSAMPLPLVLVGPRGIAFVNDAGEELLSRKDGLTACSGRYGLATTQPHEAQQLRTVIGSALIGGPGGLAPVTRQHATLPLLIEALPLAEQKLDLFDIGNASGGFALVLIRDPQPVRSATTRDALMVVYGLTEAEACVAVAIASGRNAKQIASKRDVSLATVRSQIRQVLAKTSSQDQREFLHRFTWLSGAA